MDVGSKDEIKRVGDAVRQGFKDADAVCVDRGLFEEMHDAVRRLFVVADDNQEDDIADAAQALWFRIRELHPQVVEARTAEED